MLLVVSASQKTFAQSKETAQTERIYTQTDRPFYFPGDVIWFKSYVVKEDNTVSSMSDIMYAELISPKGDIVKRTSGCKCQLY